MRVFSLTVVAVIALFAALASSAQASWKGSVFNDQTSSVTVAPDRAYNKKSTNRRSTRSTRSTSRTTKSRRTASARSTSNRRTSSRQARRGGSLSGLASYYWQPQRVASGGWFNPNALTAAHKTLPFGTRVRVTNLRNGRSVVVRINDRGPYIRGRIIDLSKRAAAVVGMQNAGVVPVRVEIL
jgi:rare lipoprotein A